MTEIVDKREHILDIAEQLFSEFGYEGTSTRHLAKEAGVNVAMISYYFGSKEKLFEAMVEMRTAATREKLAKLVKDETDPWKKLDMVIEIYVDKILSNHRFHRIMFREISLQQRSDMNSNIIKNLVKNAKELVKILQEGITAKTFRKIDPEMTVATLFGTISQATMSTSLSYLMLNENPSESCVTDEKYRQRLKDHLKDLMRAHLSPQLKK